jgi:hypothetical protein
MQMKLTRARIFQLITVFLTHVVMLYILQRTLAGFHADSLGSLMVVAIVLGIGKSAFWWVFIQLFSWLPGWMFPILAFVLNGALVLFLGNRVQGISVDSVSTGIWITLWLTAADAVVSSILELDEDAQFDRSVTHRLVKRAGKPIKTDVPGFLFFEIDGLGEKILRRAIDEGYAPTLKRWIESGTHQVIGWETDFSAQTGAMQSGILLGSNDNVPAYRWWDREAGRMIMSGMPKDALALEKRLSRGIGLCSDGGTSRGNMFSGDATESILTFSTIQDRKRARGPDFYFYLFSPYVVARIVTRFIIECIKEWSQAAAQRRRKYKYAIKARNFSYAFLRAAMGPVVQDLVTFTVISDILRGMPAIYGLYPGYDDLAHFAGMDQTECLEAIHETDRYLARIEHSIKVAPRPYHVVVLSDHGQTLGPIFKTAHGISLEDLVKSLVKDKAGIFYTDNHSEAWDNLSTVLSTSTDSDTRTAGLVRTMVASRSKDGYVDAAPQAEAPEEIAEEAAQAKVVVFGSGCSGLIYFTDSKQRMTFEQIQVAYPELLIGLYSHPGIGFVLVRSEAQGDLVVAKGGIHYLKDDHTEGVDPLANFGPLAADHLRRESSFSNCPDILVSTTIDPATQEMAGFENQVSHHGGMGGPQNHAFILRPMVLPYDNSPVVGAESVHHLLRGWREKVQNLRGLS